MLVGLGTLSVGVALCLATFGIVGTQRQAAALKRVLLLEKAVHIHDAAGAVMGTLRDEMLRALQDARSLDQQGDDALRVKLQQNVESLRRSVAENQALPLDAAIQVEYANSADSSATLAKAGQALTDPLHGFETYERFYSDLTDVEAEMGRACDLLDAGVDEVRTLNDATTALVQKTILAAAAAGTMLLVAVSAAAVLIVQRITTDLALLTRAGAPCRAA